MKYMDYKVMNRFILSMAFAMVACSVLQASPATAEQDAAILIGAEYVQKLSPGQQISSDSSCLDQGGGPIEKDGVDVFRESFEWGFADCQGRYTILLKRTLGTVKISTDMELTKSRVLDAVILPPTSFMNLDTSADPLLIYMDGYCQLDGEIGTTLIATLRWGDKGEYDFDWETGIEVADWQSGLEQAWTFDLDALRIVPIPIERVKCYRQLDEEDGY